VHPSRGVNTTDTTVLVPINMIKVANTKIIKAKLYKDIINEQDSIINLHKIKYNALHKEVETLQYNLNNSNKTNDNLNKSIERIKRNNRYLVSGGAVCAIAFIVCLLVK
jgi:predicted RNase H-like nuclease (RuvC/YqgF family)